MRCTQVECDVIPDSTNVFRATVLRTDDRGPSDHQSRDAGLERRLLINSLSLVRP
jgi:hypothetical protein